MNRMGIPQPDYTPDGVLAEIARVTVYSKNRHLREAVIDV